MRIYASQIDFPKESLDPAVWDVSKDPPMIQPDVQDFLLRIVDFLEERLGDVSWVTAIWIIGSITTNQWEKKSDVDVEVQGDFSQLPSTVPEADAWNYLERLLQKEFQYQLLPGTEHELKVYVADVTWRPLESDFRFDLLTGEWQRPPVLIPLDFIPDKVFKREKALAEKIAELVSRIAAIAQIRWVDSKHLEIYLEETGRTLPLQKDYNRLREEALNVLLRVRQELDELRRDMYKHKMSELYFPSQFRFSRQWAAPNIGYKYLEMWGVIDMLEELKRAVEAGAQPIINWQPPAA